MLNAKTVLGLGLLLGVAASGVAHAETWRVNKWGQCVSVWEPRDLLRGPTAMLDAVVAPFRYLAGGVQAAPQFWKTAPVPAGVITTPAMVLGASTGAGVIDSGIWMLTGIGDTVTGGVFGFAPDRAVDLSVAPLKPPFLNPAPTATVDRCAQARMS